MFRTAMAALLLLLVAPLLAAGMDQDPDAKALLSRLQALKAVLVAPADNFNSLAERRITGPVTIVDGAVVFPEDRSEALHLYYGTVLPQRGCLHLDFRLDRMPKDHNFMTLCEAGTPGNTKFMLRLGMDRRVSAYVLTKREQVRLTSDPVDLGKWHKLLWWYAPEGSVLQIDGVIEDYSTDPCTPYAVAVGEAFYLGDQPWWDAGGRKGVFYPLDNFVGLLDNLGLDALTP